MASSTSMDSAQVHVRPGTTLVDLRRAAGYRSSKEFAAALGIPATTYSRYERTLADPDSGVPLRAAWAIADKLNCTIDAVVGRDEADDANGRDLNALYRSLSDEGKKRLDDYLLFLDFSDRLMASKGR